MKIEFKMTPGFYTCMFILSIPISLGIWFMPLEILQLLCIVFWGFIGFFTCLTCFIYIYFELQDKHGWDW